MPLLVNELAKRLEDDHWRDRKEAAENLAAFAREAETKNVIPVLGDRLDESNWRVRVAAAEALGDLSVVDKLGQPTQVAVRAVPELFKRLGDPDLKVRHACKQSLGKLQANGTLGNWGQIIAEPAVPDLLRRLQSDDWRIREVAAKALGELGAPAIPAIPELVKCHADDGVRVRNAAKAALEKINLDIGMVGSPAVSVLVARLRTATDWRTRCGAAWALGQASGSFVTGVASFPKLLSSGDWAVRFLIARAIGELGLVALPVISGLATMADDVNEQVKKMARASLARLASLLEARSPPVAPSVRRLLRKLEDQDSHVREDAIGGLADFGMGSIGAVPDILRRLTDKIATVRLAAVSALKSLEKAGVLGSLAAPEHLEAPPPIVDVLMANLEDSNWAVRLAAAEALSSLSITAARVVRKIQKAASGQEEGPDTTRMQQAAKQVMTTLRNAGALIDRASAVLQAAAVELEDYLDSDDVEVHTIARQTVRQLIAAGLLQEPKEEDSEDEDGAPGSAQRCREFSFGPGPLGMGLRGARVMDIFEGGQAEALGIQVGDRLLALGDEPVPVGATEDATREWMMMCTQKPRPLRATFAFESSSHAAAEDLPLALTGSLPSRSVAADSSALALVPQATVTVTVSISFSLYHLDYAKLMGMPEVKESFHARLTDAIVDRMEVPATSVVVRLLEALVDIEISCTDAAEGGELKRRVDAGSKELVRHVEEFLLQVPEISDILIDGATDLGAGPVKTVLKIEKPTKERGTIFREARSRLPREVFSQLLASIKQLNNEQKTLKETLKELRKLLGPAHVTVYNDVEEWLNNGGL